MVLAGPAGSGSGFINLERLSDRVVLAYWVGLDRRCNLTAIRSRKGLVIIDTEMSPRIMAPIKEKLELVFGRSDWVYVINTHAHDNHPGGNSLFNGTVIVGHENLAEDMQWIVRGEIKFWELHSQDLREGYEVVKPSLTFRDKLTLDLGDVQLELVFFGKGHSLSDTLIYVPEEKLLVTGAIVYQRAQFPEIGETSRLDDVQRFLAVLDRFLADEVKIDHVVSSHSPPLLKKDLAPVRDYYQRMLSGVRLAQRQGLTMDQAKVRLAASRFPAFQEKPPGTWSYGMHQRPLVAVESFVDGQLFRGTLYKASHWTRLGPTAGFGRVAEDFYVRHARPKQLWVRLLQPQARAWLGAPQLELAGAAQLGCLHRQNGKDAKPEAEYLVTSRAAGKLSPEEFLNTDRQYWGVESGLHQRLDCSGFEDRLRVRHKGAVHLLGLFARVGVALFVRWAKNQRQVRDRTFPHWREWNSGHHWPMIRLVVD
jgi:glyoxylase-like metal-dependent hydrolase (beta-lactamase superfamily II)